VWSETPAHPAIISIGLWKAAQGMRRRPETDWRRRPKSGMPAKPLRGMVFCSCSRRMAPVQRARRTKESVWYWECLSCKGRIRDDRLQTEVIGVLERELLRPDRLAALERHQETLLRGRRKETLRTRTRLEARWPASSPSSMRSCGVSPLVSTRFWSGRRGGASRGGTRDPGPAARRRASERGSQGPRADPEAAGARRRSPSGAETWRSRGHAKDLQANDPLGDVAPRGGALGASAGATGGRG
jgi:hypothetical protein